MIERITPRQFQESDGVDDWREVGFMTTEESFGELHVRVAHGRVIAIRGTWSWGGI